MDASRNPERKRLRRAMMAAVMIVTLFSGGAWAVTILDLTNIDQATFDSFTGAAVNTALQSPYDFSPATAGGDGEVRSQVFAGEGNAAGLFVYIYQIVLFSNSTANQEQGISFNFLGGPATVAGVGNSFFIGTDPSPPAPFEAGSQDPSGGAFNDPVVNVAFAVQFFDQIDRGEASFVFGLFSPLAPTIVSSNVLDGTATVTDPSVYAPAPEPTGLFLLGSGLAGLALFGRRRRKRRWTVGIPYGRREPIGRLG